MTVLEEIRLASSAASMLRDAVDDGQQVRAIAELRQRARGRVPDAVAAREAGYRIRNAIGDDDTAVVRIYDEIWMLGVNAEDLVAELDTITAPNLRVEINSPGGDMFAGIAIFNALRNHPARVMTRVDGVAASAASLIFQAGDHRVMQPGTQQMIHNAWGMTIGDRRDHAQMAELLEQSDGQLAAVYAARAGTSVASMRALMDAETWLTGNEAVDVGLADEAPETTAVDDGRGTLNDQISEARTIVAGVLNRVGTQAELRARTGGTLTNAVILEPRRATRTEVSSPPSSHLVEPPTPRCGPKPSCSPCSTATSPDLSLWGASNLDLAGDKVTRHGRPSVGDLSSDLDRCGPCRTDGPGCRVPEQPEPFLDLSAERLILRSLLRFLDRHDPLEMPVVDVGGDLIEPERRRSSDYPGDQLLDPLGWLRHGDAEHAESRVARERLAADVQQRRIVERRS